ncbi:flagellar basal body rod protein FlgB [Polynucleobacter sp. UB-Piko-W3]|jgi:flagellar basal-body rod protein FlgB|uniref:flagellar basal body rod protein FlgB n=1 Tax=Polynucleobacter sp. UB-Piko-W3 TaxID=1819735 RepID=UPI001C0E3D21|nr:flagellar basal body rod protein FlgB [Polynucleobacter sp. UB-Piko-W3]MBU3554964.1 flagellar basal body rod protein FlgB [Polynucleobacter sp. UB-Piko-W3]
MNAVPQYDPLTFGENALKLRTFRQQVLGNNLANSDTPGFKARDIRFADVLKAQLEGIAPSNAVNLATTHSAHIPGKVPQEDPRLLYRIPNQPSMDGNTVDADVELTEFTKNSVYTESALTMLGGTIRSRMSAITGQPS